MRQYPIWNNIESCAYANKTGRSGNKSYGIKEHGETQILVGTSRSNSHEFVTHKTTHKQHENGDREYRFFISDGDSGWACLRRAVLRKGASELEMLPTKPETPEKPCSFIHKEFEKLQDTKYGYQVQIYDGAGNKTFFIRLDQELIGCLNKLQN